MNAGTLLVFDTRGDSVIADLPGFSSVHGVRPCRSWGRCSRRSPAGRRSPSWTRRARMSAPAPGRSATPTVSPMPRTRSASTSRTNLPRGGSWSSTPRRTGCAARSRWAGRPGTPSTTRAPTASWSPCRRSDRGGRDRSTRRHHRRAVPVRRRRPSAWACHRPAGRLLFVANEGNATLLVVDLRDMQVVSAPSRGRGPDVLAFDPGLARLYVAAESGVLSVFRRGAGPGAGGGAAHSARPHRGGGSRHPPRLPATRERRRAAGAADPGSLSVASKSQGGTGSEARRDARVPLGRLGAAALVGSTHRSHPVPEG